MNNYSYYLKYTLQYTQKIQLRNKFTKTFRRKPLPGLTAVSESRQNKTAAILLPGQSGGMPHRTGQNGRSIRRTE